MQGTSLGDVHARAGHPARPAVGAAWKRACLGREPRPDGRPCAARASRTRSRQTAVEVLFQQERRAIFERCWSARSGPEGVLVGSQDRNGSRAAQRAMFHSQVPTFVPSRMSRVAGARVRKLGDHHWASALTSIQFQRPSRPSMASVSWSAVSESRCCAPLLAEMSSRMETFAIQKPSARLMRVCASRFL